MRGKRGFEGWNFRNASEAALKGRQRRYKDFSGRAQSKGYKRVGENVEWVEDILRYISGPGGR